MPLASLSPSGGLTYHLRALRWRRRLWAPFRAQVAAWLAAWQPPCSELLLLGPSAGYTLDPAFLSRFAAILFANLLGQVHDTAATAALARQLWAGQRVKVADHGTAGLAAGGPSELALWPLTPRRWQLVAWVRHAPAAAQQA